MNENAEQKFFNLGRLIGILLTFYGVLLAGYGAVAGEQNHHSPFNVNLWWGLVILMTGVIFLLVSLKQPDVDDDEEE
ncbi:hypothetical protein [Tuberibacillus sp. Marseille-P3662]|uniref:hypothetical protein n=1 Tax=Tuberibacillus sp. Marseille-P3662 TaxID=1965358 RepID=UPI000A1C7B7C|nr:hypothetical protein [Tuberibacillus sp. Marseille-P3662]